MTVKLVIPNRHAVEDVDDAIDYYRERGGPSLGEAFATEIVDVYIRLGLHPHIGSPRPSYELEMSGVKCWSLNRFPHLVYYQVTADHVELWRVLHPRRDMNQMTLPRNTMQ